MDELEQKLQALIPASKAGKLRKYLPAIEQKLRDGASALDILSILKTHGIELTEGTFRCYLHRFRKQQKRHAESEKIWQPELPPEEMEAAKPEPSPPTMEDLVAAMQPDPDKLARDIAEKERRFKAHQQTLKRNVDK